MGYAAPVEARATTVQAPVNLNQASADELIALKGIGPKMAQRIIAYRQEHGPFQTVDQLVQVKGIGNAKFQKLKDQVTV
jgi:competence protein ComEA